LSKAGFTPKLLNLIGHICFMKVYGSNKFINFLEHYVISFYSYQVFKSKLSMKTASPTKRV